MATARDENPYEGGGVFGKFRKRPFQRTQTTPYKRLLTALRNPSRNNGWFSKLVDPAQRLIASSANMLFASVFRKRLPPSPPPPRSSEAVQEARDNHQEAAVFYEEEQVANESSGKQQGIIVESGVQINCSDGGGLTELEKLLKQKTFTRSEIDHLTTLMRSRTVDPPVGEDGKRTEVVPSDPMLPRVQIEEYPKTPALENGIENHLVSTPYVTSSVSIDDVASPAELAKAYMGSRPSKVSQSMLGLRNPPREDPTLLRNQHFAQKSPVMSIVPRATTLARVRENGFVTPRSHGRSAIYRMARTPYARVYPISTLKALKRRSSVLDNDIRSFGPIRRMRHKCNLLSSKGLTLPHSGAPLSIARNRVGIDAAQQPSSSMQKPILLGEVKHRHTKLSAENVDDTMPSTSFPPLSSKSSEMASKILQQLDTWEETTGSTAVAEKTTSATETDVQEIPPASSVVLPSKSFTTDGSPPVRSADGSTFGQKVDIPTSINSSIPDPTFKPTMGAVSVAAHTILGSEKFNSQNGSVVNPPLLNFGNKVVQSTEVTAADAPSKESTKSGPIFGLDKVASSKEPGADAPLFNFGINKNVDYVPQVPFAFSSSVGGESGGLKFGASSDSKMTSSIKLVSTTVPVAVDSMPKVLESDNADAKTNIVAGSSPPSSEPAVSSAASTSLLTSPANIFTFSNRLNEDNGRVASSATFASTFPSIGTNSFSQNISSRSSLAASSSSISATATSSSTSMTTSTPSSSSTQVVASSYPTTSFKFGSTPLSSTSLPVSSSGSEPVETKSRQDGGIGNLGNTAFGSSSAAVGSTGSGIFGLSSPVMTSIYSQSQGSVFGTTSGSVLGMLAPSATSGFTTSTQNQSVGFGSSASSPLFGLTGNTTFSSGSSLFTSSSTSASIFNSGTTSGQRTLASGNPITFSSKSSSSSTLFGLSSWKPSKPSTSGFVFATSTPLASTSSPIFGSSTGASSPQFSFTSAAAITNMQPAFGSPSPVFTYASASANNDQMSMEDSMAEDTVQAGPPATPVFGQQPPPIKSDFVFGASTPTGANPFQYASQQNIAPQNPSPFQASGSLEFNAGGSFSLGTGGGDKSGRKFVRVKHKQRKK
ncbi:nuclear pore complex protein NUP1 isoform X10 [Gastrolobium bilobum]|uniref:nuclear pore complex protein NUP1 isoform X10 n=1 Tax=Gastrolobium bilobum TaxID=150636 RepID=UPI002AB18C0D|nr:nuclear pore complex protein NUP1 isoform X10 [Gastrolobium bilobum]